MSSNDAKIKKARKEWEESVVSRALEKNGLKENPTSFYSPEMLGEFDFLEQVGFPGQYPFYSRK